MTVILTGIGLRQRVTPYELQSRVNVSARMIAWGGTPFGAALGGLLAEVVDIRIAYMLAMSGIATSLIAGLLSPLRHAHPDDN